MLKLNMRSFWPKRVWAGFPISLIVLSLASVFLSSIARAQNNQPAATSATPQVAKALGIIKNVAAGSITITPESGGADVVAKLSAATKIQRVPPGEKDLKNATTLQPQDLQAGDRVLARGWATPDGSINALSIIVMKQADVTAKQQHDRDDWQKRGVGGLVTKVDVSAGTVTVSTGGMGATKNVVIHIGKDTITRRYAAGSVKFEDAKTVPVDQFLAQIKVGDQGYQLRARGTRSADGNELAAEEVVAGSFRNIAGTVKTIDTTNSTLTVQDAITKSPVVVKISADAQMKKLPAEMAQRIAARLKATQGGATGDQASSGQGNHAADATNGGARTGGDAQTGRGNGPPDFQRMLARLPNSSLADIQKGDAVMIVSSEGTDTVTAITLLAGVDSILTAAPRAASLLSPWSLNTGGGGEGEGAQ